MILQVPFVSIPISFISTWAHELGHGLGALVTGGSFMELTIFPNFSGLALTGSSNTFQRAVSVILGLSGPAILGVFMIILTRALNWYRIAIIILAVLLAISQIWAADTFTRVTLAATTVILGLIGWKIPNKAVFYISHILAIALCLDALTSFGYFFVGGGVINGSVYRSDTGVLSDILWGPHWFWGALIAAFSIIILFAGVVLSDKWARKKDAPKI